MSTIIPEGQEPVRPAGPHETEADTRPVTRPIFEAFDADPGAGKMAPHSYRLMRDAADAAGVCVGAFDDRTLHWLAGFEASSCAVVAGLVTRAHQAAALTPGQLRVILSALDAAADAKRDAAEGCGDCDPRPEGDLCGTCTARLAIADDYDQLADELRGRL